MVVWCIPERDHPDRVPGGRHGVPTRQQLTSQVSGVLARAAAEPRQRHFKHHGVTHGGIQASRAFLDLADDHVGTIGGAAQDCVRHERPPTERATATPANDIMSGPRKPDREDIQIGDRSRMVAAIGFEHGILGHGE
jgi:hypothetical protein